MVVIFAHKQRRVRHTQQKLFFLRSRTFWLRLNNKFDTNTIRKAEHISQERTFRCVLFAFLCVRRRFFFCCCRWIAATHKESCVVLLVYICVFDFIQWWTRKLEWNSCLTKIRFFYKCKNVKSYMWVQNICTVNCYYYEDCSSTTNITLSLWQLTFFKQYTHVDGKLNLSNLIFTIHCIRSEFSQS